MPPGTHELGGSAELVFPDEGSYLLVAPRFGTVFAPGSEIELEAGYSRESNEFEHSRLAFSANYLYNFETMSAPYPFMLVGFGFARSSIEFEQAGTNYEESDTNGLFNVGAGLRVPVTESSCLRAELRYTREFADPGLNTTALRVGFSILLM
jgi:opacity protein-like surface antigen